MTSKPTYNLHDIGPVCTICGNNYLKKRPFITRCPACRRPLLTILKWLILGLLAGIPTGWLLARDIPQAGQIAIAAAALTTAVGLVLWQWVIKR